MSILWRVDGGNRNGELKKILRLCVATPCDKFCLSAANDLEINKSTLFNKALRFRIELEFGRDCF